MYIAVTHVKMLLYWHDSFGLSQNRYGVMLGFVFGSLSDDHDDSCLLSYILILSLPLNTGYPTDWLVINRL